MSGYDGQTYIRTPQAHQDQFTQPPPTPPPTKEKTHLTGGRDHREISEKKRKTIPDYQACGVSADEAGGGEMLGQKSYCVPMCHSGASILCVPTKQSDGAYTCVNQRYKDAT